MCEKGEAFFKGSFIGNERKKVKKTVKGFQGTELKKKEIYFKSKYAGAQVRMKDSGYV